MSAERGSLLGSFATSAVRYWSTTFSRQARLQLSGIGPVEAWNLEFTDSAIMIVTANAAIPQTKAERMVMLLFRGILHLDLCLPKLNLAGSSDNRVITLDPSVRNPNRGG